MLTSINDDDDDISKLQQKASVWIYLYTGEYSQVIQLLSSTEEDITKQKMQGRKSESDKTGHSFMKRF